MFGFADFVLIVHEVEDGGGGAGGLLEVVVVGAEAADGVVHLEERDDEGEEGAFGHSAVADFVAADPEECRDGDGADEVHQRRGDGLSAHGAEVGAEEFLRCLAEANELPELHVEGLHDAIAGNGFVKDVLDVGEFVLAAAGGAADIAADADNGPGGDGAEGRQHPGEAAAEGDDDDHHAGQGADLLQEIRQDGGGGVLDALDVVDERREQRSGGVLLEERNRAAQDGLVEVVAHVGDHAESGVVREVGSGVVAEALEQGCGHKGEGDHAPVIFDVEERGHQDLRRDVEVPAGADGAEQLGFVGAVGGGGVEDVVEDGADEQDAEGIEQADAGSENDRRKCLEGVAASVVEQTPEALHAWPAPRNRRQRICIF